MISIFISLGDGGYTPSPILITPFQAVIEDSAESRFNKSFTKTRVVSEETFGGWKSKFRCVLKDRSLHYEPSFAAKIITATAVLYNFEKMYRSVFVKQFLKIRSLF